MLLLPFKTRDKTKNSSSDSSNGNTQNKGSKNNINQDSKAGSLEAQASEGDVIGRSKSSMLHLDLENENENENENDIKTNDVTAHSLSQQRQQQQRKDNGSSSNELQLMSNAKVARINYEYILNGLNQLFSKWNDHTAKISQPLQSKMQFEKYFFKFTSRLDPDLNAKHHSYNNTDKYLALFDPELKDKSTINQLRFFYDILHACIVEIKYLCNSTITVSDDNDNFHASYAKRANMDTILSTRIKANTLRSHISKKMALFLSLPNKAGMRLSFIQEFLKNKIYKTVINLGVKNMNDKISVEEAYVKNVLKCRETAMVELIYRLGLWHVFVDPRTKAMKNEKEAITYFIVAHDKLPNLALQV